MNKIKLWFFAIGLCSILFSYRAFALDKNEIVIEWNNIALNRIRANGTPPPRAARVLFLMHNAAFNAFAAYDNDVLGTTRGSTLRRPDDEHTLDNKAEAISYACFRVLLKLYPEQFNRQYLREQFRNLGYDPQFKDLNLLTPSGIGNSMAYEIINFSKNDGANQLGNEPGGDGLPYSDYVGYVPVNSSTQLNDPSFWQPLPLLGGQQRFLLPIWGFVQPFAITSLCECVPPPPATYPSEAYNIQAREVLELSAALDDRTKSIAEYWADGAGTNTPPGHWNVIAQYVHFRDNYNLKNDVKLFFALNAALHDAAVCVWYVKLHYNSIRPISAIRFLYKNQVVRAWGGPCQGTQEILGQNFQSYIPTPPFPEYSSGHSAFSAAGAEILKKFTGSDCYGDFVVIPQGSSKIEPNCDVPSHDVTLRWPTFTFAADQAGISRRYGGIHFKKGDLESRKIGKQLGKQAWEKALCYIGKHRHPPVNCSIHDPSSSSSSSSN